MPIRYQSPTDPEGKQENIRRRRQLAERLSTPMAIPEQWNQMPVVPEMSASAGAARLAGILIGKWQGRKAEKEQDAMDAAKRQAMADRLKGIARQNQPTIQPGQPGSGVLRPGQPAPFNPAQEAAMQSVNALPLEQQEQILGQASMGQLFPKPPKPAEPYTLGPGDVRYGADNQQLAAAPPKPEQPQATSPLVQVMTPNGPQWMTREQAVGQTPYNQPAAPPASEPLVEVIGPDGKPVLLPRSQAAGKEPYDRPSGGLTPRDATTAKNKLTQLQVARQQLQRVKDNWLKIKGSGSAGPWWSGQGIAPTEAGSNFETAVDSMRNILTSITRVPGVGAMSDYETRLAQAQFPERGQYESSTEQKIQTLDDMLTQLEMGYSGLLSDTGPAAQSAPALPPDVTEDDISETMRANNMTREQVLEALRAR